MGTHTPTRCRAATLQHGITLSQTFLYFHSAKGAQTQAHAARNRTTILHHQHLGLIALRRRTQRRLRQHQSGIHPGSFNLYGQRHVFPQKSWHIAGESKFHFDGAALRVHSRRQTQHACREALGRKGATARGHR